MVILHRFFQPSLSFSSFFTITHTPTRPRSHELRVCPCRMSDDQGNKSMAVVVVDHGSRRASANAMLDDVVAQVGSRLNCPVLGAHMELSTPNVSDAVEACALSNVSHIIVVPFFLAPGRHVSQDVPALVQDAIQKHNPQMTYSIRPHIGAHPSIIDAVTDHAALEFLDDDNRDLIRSNLPDHEHMR